ncbi:hypothetical protein ACFSYD_21095 [Paracoccus aerius]
MTYPPLDVLKPVADDLDHRQRPDEGHGPDPHPGPDNGHPVAGGEMLIHSPSRFTAGLRRQIEDIGPIRHLVAPNIAHWTFLKDWQKQLPEAVTWAAPGLRKRAQVRKAGLRLDHDLGDDAAPAGRRNWNRSPSTGRQASARWRFITAPAGR